jgi:plastin-1
MRAHTLKFLAAVQAKKFGGQPVTDEMIVKWANDSVKAKGRSSTMQSFKDKTLSNGIFFMDLSVRESVSRSSMHHPVLTM